MAGTSWGLREVSLQILLFKKKQIDSSQSVVKISLLRCQIWPSLPENYCEFFQSTARALLLIIFKHMLIYSVSDKILKRWEIFVANYVKESGSKDSHEDSLSSQLYLKDRKFVINGWKSVNWQPIRILENWKYVSDILILVRLRNTTIIWGSIHVRLFIPFFIFSIYVSNR